MLNGKGRKFEKLLRFTEDYFAKNGTSPTLKEIAAHLKVSASTAHRYVKRLEEEGLLKKSNGKKRSITTATEKVRSKAVAVPVYSDVFGSDGEIFPDKNVLFHLWLPAFRVRNEEFFATEVYGDLFMPQGCLDGDFMIFVKSRKIKDGEVAAINDGGKLSVAKVNFSQNGFILTKKGSVKENRNEIEVVGRLFAVQRLNV